jgi:hypothetical protein
MVIGSYCSSSSSRDKSQWFCSHDNSRSERILMSAGTSKYNSTYVSTDALDLLVQHIEFGQTICKVDEIS